MRPRKPGAAPAADPRPLPARVEDVLAELRALSTEHDRVNLARFGIDAPQAFGISMAHLQNLAKTLGRDHALAAALWDTGWHEARLLTAFVDDPALVTPDQMDRWCRDFDNWGVVDTLCFKLFDRTPHAWAKVAAWCPREAKFEKRAGFALLASLAGHDKAAGDAAFLESLSLIEAGARDPRNFVKKGVSWALRRIGGRSAALHQASVTLAQRLATSPEPGPRWVGKDALRDLQRPMVAGRFKG